MQRIALRTIVESSVKSTVLYAAQHTVWIMWKVRHPASLLEGTLEYAVESAVASTAECTLELTVQQATESTMESTVESAVPSTVKPIPESIAQHTVWTMWS